MTWQEVRQHFPEQWLLVEATEAHSEGGHRILERLTVIDTFADSTAALKDYATLHKAAPQRELFVFHTSRETLEIKERFWLGVRGGTSAA